MNDQLKLETAKLAVSIYNTKVRMEHRVTPKDAVAIAVDIMLEVEKLVKVGAVTGNTR